jgi:hypothetical protein
MIYVFFILAIIIIGFTSGESMLSDSTLGKLLNCAAWITLIICIIIFVIKAINYIF